MHRLDVGLPDFLGFLVGGEEIAIELAPLRSRHLVDRLDGLDARIVVGLAAANASPNSMMALKAVPRIDPSSRVDAGSCGATSFYPGGDRGATGRFAPEPAASLRPTEL